jgi:cyclopropane fatty-acyl-phospholipid synthase-like methyltransferase
MRCGHGAPSRDQMREPTQQNRESYDAVAEQWDRARVQLSGAEERLFAMLLEHLRPDDEVLDLGCGTGRPVAERILRDGFRVVGIDQSERMLALARQRFPAATWIAAAIETFVPQRRFAAAVAWDSLFHVPREHHLQIFGRVRDALRRDGCFALTVGGSEHPPFTDTMFGESFFYDSYPPDRAIALLEQSGFSVIDSEFLNLPTGGRDKGRFAILARRAA